MSEPIKKPKKTNPKSYSPETPKMMSLLEEYKEDAIQQSEPESGLINFEIVKSGAYRFIGTSVYIGNKRGAEGVFDFMWKKGDWVFAELDGIKEYASDVTHNAALITWEKYDEKNELFGYYIGRFMKADTPVPKVHKDSGDPMDYFDIPDRYMAKAWHKGNINKRYGIFWYKDFLVDDAIKQTGIYRKDYLWSAEICLNPDENGDAIIGAYMPCERIK